MEIIKSPGIAHHSYFIAEDNRAAVIDPRRDVEVYLELAEKNELSIDYIFETHRNEDYVIGSLELANATGAEIYHGENLNFSYGNPIKENQKFNLGNIELEILETPGHTLESISILVRDLNVSDDVLIVFTGDLIFAGETGRIDFYGVENRPKMASLIYESLFEKIFPLGDHVILCPAHGAGSVCGADIRNQDYTTIGYEKRTNEIFKLSKSDFIRYKVAEELYSPPYFKKMEEYNLKGAPGLDQILRLKPLSPAEVKNIDNVQILDIRRPTSFAGGHIPGSLNIWQEGVPAFIGWFLNYKDPIVIINDNGSDLEEIRRAMIRLGYDNLFGYLRSGFPTWYLQAEEIETLTLISVEQLRKQQFDNNLYILDVRKVEDRRKGYIEGSYHIYAGLISEEIQKIPSDKEIIVYCDSGYKSTMVASYLLKKGYNVKSVLGSMIAWLNAGYPIVK